jgi:hypothetical protein
MRFPAAQRERSISPCSVAGKTIFNLKLLACALHYDSVSKWDRPYAPHNRQDLVVMSPWVSYRAIQAAHAISADRHRDS